jgi:endonuclease V-like protein UPF0215 family
VEDGSFEAFPAGKDALCFLCGVEMEGSRIVDIRIARIQVDGLDATEKLLALLKSFDGDAERSRGSTSLTLLGYTGRRVYP